MRRFKSLALHQALADPLAAFRCLGLNVECRRQMVGPDLGLSRTPLESSLRPVPSQLRTQATILGELNEDVGGIINRSAETREDLASVREGLREAEQSLARFSTTASRLQGLITDIPKLPRRWQEELGFVVVALDSPWFSSACRRYLSTSGFGCGDRTFPRWSPQSCMTGKAGSTPIQGMAPTDGLLRNGREPLVDDAAQDR